LAIRILSKSFLPPSELKNFFDKRDDLGVRIEEEIEGILEWKRYIALEKETIHRVERKRIK
jgi:hypothetical protein